MTRNIDMAQLNPHNATAKQRSGPLVLALLGAVLLIGSITGCRHTAQGAGKDIEKMGEKIQEKTR